jgi:serine/threonine protein kinase
MTLTIGEVLENRYRIVSLLGQGGMGAVYRAWDMNLRVPVALKENLDLSTDSQHQFEREALMLAQLSHPNLPRVTNHFLIPGRGQYLVMEFIDGQDLQQKLEERGRLTEAEVIPIIQQITDALTYLHGRPEPIIHRDIKPANIKITSESRAVLVDFGIAKHYSATGKTTRGAQAFTPGFSPPEQYGLGATDARSDIYATGATLYALLTGQTPTESVSRLAGATLPYPTAVSPPVTRAILQAMALEPGARYQAAGQLGEALTARPEPPRAAWPRYALVGLLVVALLVSGFFAARALLNGEEPANPSATEVVSPGEDDGVDEPTHEPEPQPVVNTDGEGEAAGTGDEPGAATVTVGPPTKEPTPEPPPTDTPTPTSPTAEPSTPTAEPPALAEGSIGASAGGRPITVYRFGEGPLVVTLVGGIHAGFAPAGVNVVERALAHFQDHPEEIPPGVALHFILNANPDSDPAPGELAGRLNDNGVDVNRNFGCAWSPTATWRGQPVNPGSGAFSEPEAQALRDYFLATRPAVVIFYDARATQGWVAPGECDNSAGRTPPLATAYANASGFNYEVIDEIINGDVSNWLVQQDIPAFFILLQEYEGLSATAWTAQLNGIRATIAEVSR